MEIKESLKYLLFGLTLSIFSPVFCYGYANETTHPALTKETIEFFNYNYPNLKLSKGEKLFVEKGSEKEDSPEIRCVNHFYDPVYNVGLLNVNFSAKNWSQNTRAQAGFNIASVGTIKNYFSANSDYSWDRAVYEYTWGNKQRGLEALGHVLHLIQDMSVPPHVRNDQHMTDPSPYETFTKDFGIDNIYDISSVLISENEKPVITGSLDNYFYKLASFTNKNFFSESTLPNSFSNRYKEPKVEFEKVGFGFTGRGDYKLVKIKHLINKLGEDLGIEYSVKDDDNLILTDYWNILSKQAVLHGAGVIKLFFDEVEKERKTQALYNLNKSFAQKATDKIVSTGEKIASNVYSAFNWSGGSSGGAENLALVSEANNIGINPDTEKEQTVEKPVDKPVDKLISESETQQENRQPQEQNQKQIFEQENSKPEEQINLSNNQELLGGQEQQNGSGEGTPPMQQTSNNSLNSYSPGFGGGGGGTPTTQNTNTGGKNSGEKATTTQQTTATTTQQITITTQKTGQSVIINSPTIITPSNFQKFTQNSIIFTGKASSTNIIYSDFNNSTTSTDKNENWRLILEDFEQGSTTISFFASNKEQTATSTATTTEIFVDSMAPKITLNVLECQNSLSQTGCLLATTTPTINASWSSDGDDFSYFILNQNGKTSTTTATTTQISISGNQTYNLSVSAVDNMGNISDPATQIIEINNIPVSINEIAWMGTSKDNANDEWIELYNNTDHEIFLDNWTLHSEDGTPYIPLSGFIPANGYYLMERTDDTTVSDISADLIYTGALSNSGEHLFLSLFENNATTTVDEVLKANYWNQKGSRISYVTMEKYDSNVSGTDWSNWNTAMPNFLINGKDSNGGNIKGTPKARNSVNYLITNYGSLDSDKILVKENSPYFITNSSFDIKEGATLTVEEGVVVKFAPSQRSRLRVWGTINSKGTAKNPVVFTSFYDDEYGGDMNMDGICEPDNASSTSVCPSAGNWKQILIEPTSVGSSFDHTIVRYGGLFKDGEYMKSKGMVTVDGTDVIIKDSVFEKSMSRGVQLINVGSDTEIIGNIFRDNNWSRNIGTRYPYGLESSGGSPLIKDNLFENNVYGLNILGSGAIIESNIFNGNTQKAILSSGANVFSNNSGSDNGLNGISLIGDITVASSTNTLKKNQLPYVINLSNVTIVASSTLKIDPGVVVKFDNRPLFVYGNIEISGSDTEKVLFTALADDSDGNDAQNDGLSLVEITPTNKEITYLRPGSSSKIINAEFRYMWHALDYKSCPINLENVTFRNNEWAIYADADSVVQTAENIIFDGNNSTSTIPLF